MLALLKPDGSSLSISRAKYEQWVADYPSLDIRYEITRANDWMARNPGRAWKTLGGFENWLKRNQANAPKDKRQKLSETVPAEESSHYALRYEREHPPEPSQRSSVETMLRALEQFPIPHTAKEEVEVITQFRCQHEFQKSFHGGGDWCAKCGMFAAQWFCLDMDKPKKCFCRRVVC